MLLSLTSIVSGSSSSFDATDLGYLLNKHPKRVRTVDVKFGQAHVFYPEANPHRCTATLLVEVDPIRLSRATKGGWAQNLEPYVNDRPYAASSLLSVALGRMFGSALAGRCEAKPELVDRAVELEIELPVVGVRGGEEILRRLFEPLGYRVECSPIMLDEQFPEWGESRYLTVKMVGTQTVKAALEHLFVLLPVLDDRKHYWIGGDEVDKLLRRGGEWLPGHPDHELIARRYLRYGGLARQALARLAETADDPDTIDGLNDRAEETVERPLSLNQQRHDAVMGAVVAAGGGKVVDLGCGEGRLLSRLLAEPGVVEVLGVDVSIRALERAERRLRLDQLSERRRERIRLVQGALTYRDHRLDGFDVAVVMEVIEHIDPERLDVFAQVQFEQAGPRTVIVTTPNREYNVHFDRLDPT
ncbi:MAG: 3' terminal RNA ribose 2'-O-methyltransferase Hen1, partial [Actinomycetia bacterium]|nr:3' terminal RNA ribose 2'-O-methyltransferase Hen1 [Actinomycetes bacterium]